MIDARTLLTRAHPLRQRDWQLTIGASLLFALALGQGNPVAIPDLMASEYRHETWLGQQGYRGALVSALGPTDRQVGALAVFTRKPRQFTSEDLLLADTIVSLASSTVARVRAEAALGEQGKWAERIIETGPALVLVPWLRRALDAPGRAERDAHPGGA